MNEGVTGLNPQTRHLVPQNRPRRLRKGLVLCTLIASREPLGGVRLAMASEGKAGH